jgi:hypothetical protein
VVPSALHDSYHTSLPVDLAKIVDTWAALPAAVRAGILAMVEASAVQAPRAVGEWPSPEACSPQISAP